MNQDNHSPARSILAALVLGLLLSSQPLLAAEKPMDKSASNSKQKHNGDKTLPLVDGRFMFSVTLHSSKKIASLLDRADQLSHTMRKKGNHSKIALVLHGPEIKLFSKKNYKMYQNIVDKASRLDGDKLIEIKICKTKMDELKIKDEDIPAFVEIIPYAPDEEQRLLEEGYIYL